MTHDNHGFEAKIVADSIAAEHGTRLITMQLRYPRFIHAEFMTHRVFSRNAGSSRAIPVAKMLAQVREEPAMPIHWGKNQPGMQAHEECHELITVPGELWRSWLHFNGVNSSSEAPQKTSREQWWRFMGWLASLGAEAFSAAGYHKQVVNRRLEADQFISVIVTATEWANFFTLRDHEDAQPEIRFLAQLMKKAMDGSEPVTRSVHDWDNERGWHMPYITAEERAAHSDEPLLLCRMSAARCARVSYLTHESKTPSMEDDLKLFDRLVGSEPLHASPVEHQAQPTRTTGACRNFKGWRQHRVIVEDLANVVPLPASLMGLTS